MGDVALRSLGIETVVSSELVEERALLFKENFPETTMVVGDIWDTYPAVIDAALNTAGDSGVDVLLATPPCQGMSSAGRGKLLAEVKRGRRPSLDPRNRLVIPAMKVARELQPRAVVLENVPAMSRTLIVDEQGTLIPILDFIKRELGADYVGTSTVVNFADYGVPQSRNRLITVYSKDRRMIEVLRETGTILHRPSHCLGDGDMPRWRTVRDAIGDFPPLDAVDGLNRDDGFHPLHRVPVLDPKKHWWVSNTPEGDSAFNNQCVNTDCGFQGNPTHGSSRNAEGSNTSKKDTPVFCARCGHLLPRPAVQSGGETRIMRGFTSSYRRMDWDKPAPTLTQNFSYPSSDTNIHPDQNRVLSIYEALTLHTVSQYNYRWEVAGTAVRDGLIRESIGESVPPQGFAAALETLNLLR